MLADWRTHAPDALRELVRVGECLSLTQLALRCMIPGVPDIYQGTETGLFALTDPDNRAPLDPAAPVNIFGARKRELLRELLSLRRQHREIFALGACRLEQDGDTLRLIREHGEDAVVLRFARDGSILPEAFAMRRTADARHNG
jgi:(1->4)-alpha-D-glucan 1-alpha-D-glucosylmutase